MDRITELSRMSKAQLKAEESRAMSRLGMKRVWQAGPMSTDELISSILELERQSAS